MQEFPPEESQDSDFSLSNLTPQDAPTVPQSQPLSPRQRSPWLIFGMLGGLAVVLAFTLFITTHHVLAQGNVQGANVATTATPTHGNGHRWAGGPGFMGQHGPFQAVTITSISDQTITGTGRNGATKMIKVTSSTTYHRGSTTISLGDLAKGNVILAMGTKNSDGSLTATSIMVQVPHSGGKISHISGNSITVQSPRGTDTIQVTSTTTYVNAQTKAKIGFSDLKVGDFIQVEGAPNSSNVFVATNVDLVPAGFGMGHGSWKPSGTPVASPSGV